MAIGARTVPCDVPDDVILDLRTLIEYNWNDELRDFIAVGCNQDPDDQNGIFPRLVRLKNWLEGTLRKPEDFVQETDIA